LTALVRELAAGGTAVLAITHDREFANDACDRVVTMRAGRVIGDLLIAGEPPAVDALFAADVPLADVPATVRELAGRGVLVTARTVDDLVATFR
jgi:ABC-type hemin transport system ATPase subunit